MGPVLNSETMNISQSSRLTLVLAMVVSSMATALVPAAHGSAWAGATVDRIVEDAKGSTIHLKSNGSGSKKLTTPLYAVKELAFLESSEGGVPHLLVTGLPCKNCEEKVIFMLPVNGSKPFQFVYPGRIVDPKSRAVLMESRAFYGKCMSGNTQDVYLVFQKERVDRRRSLQSSVYVAEPGKEFIKEKLMERTREMPRLESTLKRVKTKLCFEIVGRTRTMLAKPLDLTPRAGTGDDDDDKEEAPKESQTQDELPSAQDSTD